MRMECAAWEAAKAASGLPTRLAGSAVEAMGEARGGGGGGIVGGGGRRGGGRGGGRDGKRGGKSQGGGGGSGGNKSAKPSKRGNRGGGSKHGGGSSGSSKHGGGSSGSSSSSGTSKHGGGSATRQLLFSVSRRGTVPSPHHPSSHHPSSLHPSLHPSGVLWVAEGPDAFADAAIDALSSPALWHRVSRRALRHQRMLSASRQSAAFGRLLASGAVGARLPAERACVLVCDSCEGGRRRRRLRAVLGALLRLRIAVHMIVLPRSSVPHSEAHMIGWLQAQGVFFYDGSPHDQVSLVNCLLMALVAS